MAVCIAGMHRSGTSMVAQALHLSGVDLGPEERLKPAAPDNPQGFWEHEDFVALNQRVLASLGGAWDFPPPPGIPLPPASRRELERDAASLVRGFDGDSWGWKDPRNSLTLHFWRDVVPDLRVLVVVRHPLEVAVSLRRRNLCSPTLAMTLWGEYSARIVAESTSDHRVVSHYDRWFEDAAGELRRVLGALGVDATDDGVEHAVAAVDPGTRRNRAAQRDGAGIEMPPDVAELYALFCAEAGMPSEGATATSARHRSRSRSPWLGLHAIEQAIASRDVQRAELQTALGQARATISRFEAENRELAARLSAADAEVAHLGVVGEVLRESLSAERTSADRLSAALGSSLSHVGKLVDGPANVAAAVAPAPPVLVAPVGLTPEPLALLERIETKLAAQSSEIARLSAALDRATVDEAHAREYQALVDQFRHAVTAATAPGATIAVVSRGDEQLLTFTDRTGSHFPSAFGDAHAGYHPADDLAAVTLLEVARAHGAEFLAFPATERWWLDHYTGLRGHLERHYRLVTDTPHVVVWSLVDAATAVHRATAAIEATAAAVERELGTTPGVLDWDSGLELETRLAAWGAFEAGDASGDLLPFFDGTVDVVVVSEGSEKRAAEARRVARTALAWVQCTGVISWEWLRPAPPPLPSATVIIPCHDGAEMTVRCVRSVLHTIEPDLDVEILVIDDASNDRTDRALAGIAAVDRRLRVVRNEQNLGFLRSCNTAAELADGEVLVFLNNDTIPLPGWLSPLLRTLQADPTVGVAGGKLVYPDGTLQEAGGVVFDDGRGANFGKHAAAPGAPLFAHLRDVDYCSGALLAIERRLFAEVGGFDLAFAPAYYEDTDLCFTVRQRGRRVVFQPESVVVHLEGASSGTDPMQGAKRHQLVNRDRFVQKWADALSSQPTHPGRFDEETWFKLAAAVGRR